MINDALKAQITIICYRHVSSEFAAFCNPDNRGAKFKWGAFPYKMENTIPFWLVVADLGNYDEIVAYAGPLAREIAEHLINRAGFIEETV